MARVNDAMEPSEDQILYAAQNPTAVAEKQTDSSLMVETFPGIQVDQSRFVVLASRLGRMMEPLPKRNENDEKEELKYAVPEAFERGEIITIKDIWIDRTGKIDNLGRLMRTGAIGRLDHPDAAGAIEGLRYRRAQEASIMADRGILAT